MKEKAYASLLPDGHIRCPIGVYAPQSMLDRVQLELYMDIRNRTGLGKEGLLKGEILKPNGYQRKPFFYIDDEIDLPQGLLQLSADFHNSHYITTTTGRIREVFTNEQGVQVALSASKIQIVSKRGFLYGKENPSPEQIKSLKRLMLRIVGLPLEGAE